MVAALRKAKREVTYVVYPDEGHGFARPENNLDFYGRVEEFLPNISAAGLSRGKRLPAQRRS
jgi:dipeptidyl aminopeptidase/acylaminoacyl peptidase